MIGSPTRPQKTNRSHDSCGGDDGVSVFSSSSFLASAFCLSFSATSALCPHSGPRPPFLRSAPPFALAPVHEFLCAADSRRRCLDAPSRSPGRTSRRQVNGQGPRRPSDTCDRTQGDAGRTGAAASFLPFASSLRVLLSSRTLFVDFRVRFPPRPRRRPRRRCRRLLSHLVHK